MVILTDIVRNCGYCGKEFHVPLHSAKSGKGTKLYCSQECCNKATVKRARERKDQLQLARGY